MSRAILTADRLVTALERALVCIATAVSVAIMLIIVCDVVMRYFLRSPLVWATELIGWYLLVTLFYFTLSGAFRNHSHVRVDILRAKFPVGAQRLSEAAICVVSALAFGLIALLSAQRALESFIQHEAMSGVIEWPTWPPPALVAFGAGLMTLRLLLNAISYVAAALGGSATIGLPPASGHGGEGDVLAE